MRIGMVDGVVMNQVSVRPQFPHNFRIGFAHEEPTKMFHFRLKYSTIVYRVIGIKPVFLADYIVFLPMAGCYMNASGPLLQGHMLTQNDLRVPVDKRVTTDNPFQLPANTLAEYFVPLGSPLEDKSR